MSLLDSVGCVQEPTHFVAKKNEQSGGAASVNFISNFSSFSSAIDMCAMTHGFYTPWYIVCVNGSDISCSLAKFPILPDFFVQSIPQPALLPRIKLLRHQFNLINGCCKCPYWCSVTWYERTAVFAIRDKLLPSEETPILRLIVVYILHFCWS